MHTLRRLLQREVHFARWRKGFVLIELLIVVGLIAILALIAIPRFQESRIRAYNAAALSDVKNAYAAAKSYFSEHPDGVITVGDLQRYGYQVTEGVTLVVNDGSTEDLEMSSKHDKGTVTYTIDESGSITSSDDSSDGGTGGSKKGGSKRKGKKK